MSGRVVSDIQTRAEGEISIILYQIYNLRYGHDFLCFLHELLMISQILQACSESKQFALVYQ
jgi:hypothetical protein